MRGYIEKVSQAEKQEAEQRTFPLLNRPLSKAHKLNFYWKTTERMTVDKAAANRFIKHAITQATRTQGQPSTEPADHQPTPGPCEIPARPVPAGATNKMLARIEWEKQVKEAAEEEEDLQVFEETDGYANADADVEMINDEAPAPTSLPVGTGETTPSEQRPGMFVS